MKKLPSPLTINFLNLCPSFRLTRKKCWYSPSVSAKTIQQFDYDKYYNKIKLDTLSRVTVKLWGQTSIECSESPV